MSKGNVLVYQNLRPPVAAEQGNPPVRGKSLTSIFGLANGNVEDRSGTRITFEQIVQNYTDDGKLDDAQWNRRHHVSPSHFNSKNHKYYKVSVLER